VEARGWTEGAPASGRRQVGAKIGRHKPLAIKWGLCLPIFTPTTRAQRGALGLFVSLQDAAFRGERKARV
jgi:hypothetical protein